ncbi:MAG: hypothetical protein N2691_03035 [Patescibacteria group bacterium]|nr:hypothetical protein [Patescibacteria group bacterium]
MNYLKYSIEFKVIEPRFGERLIITDLENKRSLHNLSSILDHDDISVDEELLRNVEGVLMGNPLGIHYQVENDYEADVKRDLTRIINGNLDDEKINTDIVPTTDLRDLLKEVIEIKKKRSQRS